jgi:hypothetical protein
VGINLEEEQTRLHPLIRPHGQGLHRVELSSGKGQSRVPDAGGALNALGLDGPLRLLLQQRQSVPDYFD